MAFSPENLISLIKLAFQHNASDIHLRTNEPPSLRIRGELITVESKPLKVEDVYDIAKIIIRRKEDLARLKDFNEYDGGFGVSGLCRIRFNYFKYHSKPGVILRLVKDAVPSIDDLGLPKVLKKIATQKRGLILVTGPTGSGKTTTLASMIRYMNENFNYHILTIEDPIEYIHKTVKAKISQREVGRDTENYTTGLRSALRQDPDVLLIGEMRDPETVQTALKAAETGHLVLSTMHTTNALATIGRMISLFPESEREEVKKRLSVNLYATVGQRMLKRSDTNGVVIAQEVMITSPGVKECILGNEPLERILKIMHEAYKSDGSSSMTFDQHVMELYENDKIDKETALNAVTSQTNFLQKLELS